MLKVDRDIPLPVEHPVALSNKRRANKVLGSTKRNEAIAAGQKTYFTGVPCKKGHLTARFVAGRMCVECQRAKLKLYKATEQGKLASRKNWLKNAYGISVEQYLSILAAQQNTCAICRSQFTATPHLDHCHNTGKVRAILCAACNKGIGHFNHSAQLLRLAVEYCEKHQ